MIRIFTSFVFTLLSVGILTAQTTSISGIINNYAAVSNIDNSDACAPFITVDDASAFAEDDYIMIIQMKGAEIDTSNSASFGQIINLNSAGLYEKAQIGTILGNDIYLSTLMENTYDVNGYVQIVSIPQYQNAQVDAAVTAIPWNGSIGGIVAFEVEGTLTLNDKVEVSGMGFRGAEREVLTNICNNLLQYTGYHFPMGDFRGAPKGEGIAESVGREKGRGPLATGGGGGNDHNSGGGGGSNFGKGGNGGLNLTPTPGTCIGNFPGIGGNPHLDLNNRLFLGGGGGAGHDNNDTGSDGANGGGIIYVKANTVIGSANYIRANGNNSTSTLAFDGGGGGGAGGTILFDTPTINSWLFVEARGGKGSDMNALGDDVCMGPGGGGGGGIVYTDAPFTDFSVSLAGGASGIVVNSGTTCNGTSMSAQAGEMGTTNPTPALVTGEPIIHMNITSEPTNQEICDGDITTFSIGTDIPADTYQWQINNGGGYSTIVDGTNYSGSTTTSLEVSNLAAGTYSVQCIAEGGCGDILMSFEASLIVNSSAEITLQPESQILCEGEEYILETDATTGSNLVYQWQLDTGSGFNDIMDNSSYSGSNTNALTVQVDLSMDGYQFQCIASNDCPGSATTNIATLDVNPLAVPDFSYYVSNDTVFISDASSGATNILWDFGDGSALHPGGVPYYVYEESGTYNVTVYAVNDCGTTSETIPVTIDIMTGLYNVSQDLNFTISPNPTHGLLQVDLSSENFNQAGLYLYDVSGKRLMNTLTEDNINSLDLSGYPTGIYLLQIVIEGRTSISKIVKQ